MSLHGLKLLNKGSHKPLSVPVRVRLPVACPISVQQAHSCFKSLKIRSASVRVRSSDIMADVEELMDLQASGGPLLEGSEEEVSVSVSPCTVISVHVGHPRGDTHRGSGGSHPSHLDQYDAQPGLIIYSRLWCSVHCLRHILHCVVRTALWHAECVQLLNTPKIDIRDACAMHQCYKLSDCRGMNMPLLAHTFTSYDDADAKIEVVSCKGIGKTTVDKVEDVLCWGCTLT